MERIVYLYLIPLVCVPGVVTAALSCTVFLRMRRTSLDVLLCGLSLFDVLVLACSLLIYPPMTACLQEEIRNHNASYDAFVCKFFWRTTLVTYPVSLIAQVGSVWMCVAVTVDRFMAVSFPMRRISICTPANAAAAVAAITLFSILYKLPAAFEVTLDVNGKMTQTSLNENEFYIAITKVYGYILVLVMIPWTTIIVLNVIIIRKIRKAYNLRSTLTNSRVRSERREEAERRMTIMSVVVATMFILTSLPSALNHVLEYVVHIQHNATTSKLIPLSNLLVCINSANNMIIYIVFNRKFRMFVLELLTPWLNKRRRRCSTLISELEKSKSSFAYDRSRLTASKAVISSFDVISRPIRCPNVDLDPPSSPLSLHHPHHPLHAHPHPHAYSTAYPHPIPCALPDRSAIDV